MNYKLKLTTLLLLVSGISGSCQKHCGLSGNWILSGTQTVDGKVNTRDRASFSTDSMTLASGFFYPIVDQNNFQNWQLGYHPFVYYGNSERFKIVGDSLYLYSSPYRLWDRMKITCNESGTVRLIGEREEWVLTREKSRTDAKRKYTIKYITAHIYEFEDVSNYALDYRVSYSRDDKLVYQQLSKKDPDHTPKNIKLKPGTFAEISKGFDYLDVTQIDSVYEANFSDPGIIELEIGLEDGRVIKSRLEEPAYPEELKLALTPVLYGHQKILYGHLKPIDVVLQKTKVGQH